MAKTATRIALATGLIGVTVAAGVMTVRSRQSAAYNQALAQALLEVRGEMCSGRNLKGSGVRMEVFASSDTTAKPLQSGLVPLLDLNVSPSRPVTPGQTVRWSGWVKAPASGKHRFHLTPGVAGRLALSKATVLDSAKPSDSTGTEFEEARFYPFSLTITVDQAATDAGTWLLSWSRDDQQAQPVTRGYLFPPTDAAKPAVVASGASDR